MAYNVLDFRRRRASGGFSLNSLFAAGEPGDAWMPEREFCYTKSGGGLYERVTTTGDETARITGMVNGINADEEVFEARPLYSEGGGLSWLAFDGVNDSMVTPTITPATDKVQVFAGVRKLSDASFGMISEAFAASSNGIFSLYGKNSPGWEFVSRGTSSAVANIDTGYPAPRSDVLTGISDISGPSAVLRVSGDVVETVTTSQGSGNFLSYPLHIGARGGTSLFFNGNMYGLIIRFGPNLTAAQISDTETYMAARTGVTL
jgi:hypothetical protein